MVALKWMQHLRVVGSAFLIQGQVVYCGHDAHIAETYKGPCMLPPSPALYVCGTDIKASCLLPMSFSLYACGPHTAPSAMSMFILHRYQVEPLGVPRRATTGT